jgi:hypothetical protein
MRAHLDKKPSGGVAIAFFVITLLTPVALAILLSRLNAFFEANAQERLPWHAVWAVWNGGVKKGVQLNASPYG